MLDVPAADVSGDFCNSSFTEGKASMIITGPWKIADFTKANINFGIAPIPIFPNESKNPASFSGVRLAFVSAYSNHAEQAKDFATFLMSKEALIKRFEMTKQLPPRADIKIKDPLSAGILEQAQYASPMPTIPEMGIYWSTMATTFANIWDGDSVEENLSTAASAMEAAK
nr:extracellular solute-binding protein [Treponema phagedenis]